jgi:predicted  nucleic acid-binding Zn-ribbon protein
MSKTNRTAKELSETIRDMKRIVEKLNEEIEASQKAIRQAQLNINAWQHEIDNSLQQKLRTQGQIEIMEQWLTETEG